MYLKEFIPALKYGAKILPSDITGLGLETFSTGNIWYVDGDNGSDTYSGNLPEKAFATIQAGVTAASVDGGIVYVKALDMAAGATDPSSYAETVIIPAGSSRMSIIGVSANRTQGGLPQIKIGAGSTAMMTVRAPGCLIANIGFNGISSTGGGILLDDDGSTKTAFGTAILGCHFKNCVGTTATNAATGGAIMWSSTGGAWQVLIKGNMFYKNVGDIVLKGTTAAVPQDVVIEDNIFSGPAANVDCNLYLAGGSGMNGVIVKNNDFACFPAIGSGTNSSPAVLTGCVGLLSGNRFGCTGKTFGAAGNVLIPTTVLMTDNYQEGGTTQIART